MCQSSNLRIRRNNSESNSSYSMLASALWVSVACACMLYAQYARAAGGCGSICLPLEALDLDKVQIPIGRFRMSLITEYARFGNFKEGGDSLTNTGGNAATIIQNNLAVDYGYTRRITASILLPYIKKEQQTKKFGTRVAQGIGDISLFGRYEMLPEDEHTQRQSISLGIGIKFPSGSIDEPRNDSRLPPAFQTGSGAYDLIPTGSFILPFGKAITFGNLIWRIPLEENKRGYKFGQELELNAGIDYSTNLIAAKRLSFQFSVSYLAAGRDSDSDNILPGRLRDGTKVKNTGGNFVDIVPGLRIKLSGGFTLQARYSIPIYENWNGDRSNNIGQVAPDISYQLTLIYTGN